MPLHEGWIVSRRLITWRCARLSTRMTAPHSRVAMSADRWLTYADAAALLGMTVDSLRHRARRDHWGKRISNEGKALVLVPLDAVRIPAGGAPGETAGDPPASRPATRPEPDLVAVYVARIAELERRIADLRTDLDGARQERDRERDERHAERDRADRITADLAEIARQFAAATLTAAAEGRARETVLEAKLDAARAEMAALRNRPWWARLAQLARG